VRAVAIVDGGQFYVMSVEGAGEESTLYLQRLIDTFDG